MKYPRLQSLAETEIHRLLPPPPPPVRNAAANLPVAYLPRPDPPLLRDGIEPDTLGLFVGPALDESPDDDPLPPEILLFLSNIWDYAEHSLPDFLEEIRITYLHELGHYLGLDEQDLFQRDLD